MNLNSAEKIVSYIKKEENKNNRGRHINAVLNDLIYEINRTPIEKKQTIEQIKLIFVKVYEDYDWSSEMSEKRNEAMNSEDEDEDNYENAYIAVSSSDDMILLQSLYEEIFGEDESLWNKYEKTVILKEHNKIYYY